ncbi:MAG: zinc ribbon domain-containing protein [Candidatus Heimdallarchaeota archaeon]
MCAADPAFWLSCLVDEAFVHQTFLAAVAQSLTPHQLTQGCQAIQAVAKNRLFHELYPHQFLQLYPRLATIFNQLSAESPEAFQATSLMAIKATILNANTPWLQQLKAELVKTNQLAPTTSLWAPHRSFAVAETDFAFRSRTLWAAVVNQYFAYRNNILRDAALQFLASYLTDATLVSRKELLEFFQEIDFARPLARRLYARLRTDLENQFPGWDGVQPTWAVYLNELRQIRNRTCEALSDVRLFAALQTYGELSSRGASAQTILESFVAETQKRQKPLSAYLVDVLMRKLKQPLRKHFTAVWNNYFRHNSKPASLKGMECFLYDHLRNFVKEIPNYRQYTPAQMWQALHDPSTRKNRLYTQLEKARPVFEKLITQIDFQQLAHQAIEAFVEKAYVKTSTEADVKVVIPHKRKVFRAIHRATPLRTFQWSITDNPTPPDEQALQACLTEFLQTRFQRRAEEVIRPALAEQVFPTLQEVLKDPTHFRNNQPDFRNPGFSLAIADRQMYELNLETKEFKLVLATPPAVLRDQATWFTFAIHDAVTPHARKRHKVPRLTTFLENGWVAQNPTLVYRGGHLYLHIPFAKQNPPKQPSRLAVGKRSKLIKEIVIGPDLGVKNYAVISVLLTHSRYCKTEANSIERQLLPEKTVELAHYYINDIEALDVKFDPTTGRFKNGKQTSQGFSKRKSTPRRGKGKLRFLRNNIQKTQAQRNNMKTTHPLTYEANPAYQQTSRQLSALWEKTNQILMTTAQSVAAKLRDIVAYYAAQYPQLPIRVQVEDLRWSQHGTRWQVGSYLAHNQILFFHSQIQNRLAHLLRDHEVGVWRVNPKYTSQRCAYCGQKGRRQKASFICTNAAHRTPQGKRYTSNADLNAARNIAQFPPRSVIPIHPS